VRRLPHHVLLHLLIFFFLAPLLIQGCARPVLQTLPASEQEIASALESFARYQEISASACSCCLDAEADAALFVSGWFSDRTAKLSGYLQAMEPAYIKFVAINPLGQPMYIFMTNGSMFKNFNVFEEKAYLGSVHSETYTKFAPSGFEPGFAYYWLTGRLSPGDIQVKAVMSDKVRGRFWLQIHHADEGAESMVLFDPGEMVILRHVLQDVQGRHLLDIVYAEHQTLSENKTKDSDTGPGVLSPADREKELCRVPALITVASDTGAKRIELRLHAFLDGVSFSEDDFHLEIPDNFEQLLVR